MSKLFESYLAGQLAICCSSAPMFWPTVNSYKRLGRRLLGAGEAHVGRRQPHGLLPRASRVAEVHAPRDALPRRRHEPYLASPP
jgi:hypothetical protein